MSLTPEQAAEYERTVPYARLQELLTERRRQPCDLVRSTVKERPDPRPCECGHPIQPGGLYVVTDRGPEHVTCGQPKGTA
jgi:hypothetical protein